MKKMLFAVALLVLGNQSWADNKPQAAPHSEEPDAKLSSRPAEAHRNLATESEGDDIAHYQNLSRRVGITLGTLIPTGDFSKNFNYAPAIGLHYTWEAIRPFGFTLGMLHADSSYKGNAAAGKLSITAINLLGQASFPTSRYIPFVQFGATFLFNNVSFDGSRVVTAGNDSNLTTLGVTVGTGMDFVVGRELSIGFDASFTYPIPKKVTTTGEDFNLGSPFGTANLRLSF